MRCPPPVCGCRRPYRRQPRRSGRLLSAAAAAGATRAASGGSQAAAACAAYGAARPAADGRSAFASARHSASTDRPSSRPPAGYVTPAGRASRPWRAQAAAPDGDDPMLGASQAARVRSTSGRRPTSDAACQPPPPEIREAIAAALKESQATLQSQLAEQISLQTAQANAFHRELRAMRDQHAELHAQAAVAPQRSASGP